MAPAVPRHRRGQPLTSARGSRVASKVMSVPTFPPSTATRRAPGRSALVVVCCVWALVAGMLPAVAQTDADALRSELEQVEAEQAELSQSLGEATARVDDL